MFRPEFALTMSLLLLGGVPAQSAPFATKVPPAAYTSAPVKLLRDDPLLQTSVTLDAVEQPLGDVLAGLSRTLKLDLSAEQNIADQRVTLHISGQPVYALMSQLLSLLSHDTVHPYGYHWGSLDRVKGERSDYQLWRDSASLAQEQAERDRPRQQLTLILRDMRDQAQKPSQMVTVYPGATPQLVHDPDDPQNIAFRGLTNTQIDDLVNGEIVFLDLSLDTADTTARRAIQVIPADEDFDSGSLDRAGQFDLCIGDVAGGSDLAGKGAQILDTNSTLKDPDPLLRYINLPRDTGPQVDLAPYLAVKTVTPEQKGDFGFTLQALAKAAHFNIYGESFLRTSIMDGRAHPGLDVLQGSVPRLVAQICSVWNYHAQAVPGGYLFWSRTWAEDKAQDVPERLIAPWRRRLKKNGVLSLYDRAEMASSLTWPQIALTLTPALPEAGQENGIDTYRELKVFGSLALSEQTQALSPEGLAVSEMSAWGQAALASDYRSRLNGIPSDQLAQSVLHFRTEEAPELNVLRLIMSVDANGHSLLEMRCIMPLKAGETGKPAL